MSNYLFSDSQFAKAISASTCVLETLNILKMRSTGANYSIIRKRIEELNLDVSHWKIQKLGRKGRQLDLDEILVKDSTYYYTSSLKRRLLREGLLEYRCYTCGIHEWEGQPLSLDLDHISGDHKDNRIDNLRMLCPNCHSQTPTCGSRNMRVKKQRLPHTLPISTQNAIKAGKKKQKYKKNFCAECHKGISRTATRCKSCYGKQRENTKIIWPSSMELFKMVKETSYTEVSRLLGVSDNAVRKRLKRHS